MSIFNNVSKPIKNNQAELFVIMKYGEPKKDFAWVEQLPNAVVCAAVSKIDNNYHARSAEDDVGMAIWRGYLSGVLSRPGNVPMARRAIIDSLVEYHTLLG